MKFLGEDSPGFDEEPINFYFEGVDLALPVSSLSVWVSAIIKQEKMKLRHVSFIFCTDEYLHRLNIDYLAHDTLTDVITFPYSDAPMIEGDIFISVDRVQENAAIYQTTFENELYRVMIHGIFHLCGYSDKTEEETKLIRQKEDAALTKLNSLKIT